MLSWLVKLVSDSTTPPLPICPVLIIIHFSSSLVLIHTVSAALNVMSMYHDTLLAKMVKADPKNKPLLPSSLHTRYTRAWSEKTPFYRWAARALELIRFVELLVEMGLRRKTSAENRWRGILFLESIKYAHVSSLIVL